MRIDLLYFDGCPSWQSGFENLKAALAAEGMQAEIRLVRVEDNAEAARPGDRLVHHLPGIDRGTALLRRVHCGPLFAAH